MIHFPKTAFSGRIGVARRAITPRPGIYCRNWGAATHDVAVGVHRPLTLTALTLQTGLGSRPLVLVDADLGWFTDPQFAQEFLGDIRESLGLDPAEFLFGLTHTHAAPPLIGKVNPDWEGGEYLAGHMKTIREATIAAVRGALANAQDALLEWHIGRCQLAANRDLPHEGRFVVGHHPAVPADDTLLVGRITSARGKALATIANYACHPTTLAWENRLISPDFVGAMRETVESATGGAPALFLQGASGELAPKAQYVSDTAVADRHGCQLGHAVLSTLADMEEPGQALAFAGIKESGAPLALWRPRPVSVENRLDTVVVPVEVPLRQWPQSEALEAEMKSCTDRALGERLRRKWLIRQAVGEGDSTTIPVYLWRVGPAFVCGTMLEAYSWIQQSLRSAFPEHPIVWLNLVNGSLGYAPPAFLYDSDLYPVWQTPLEQGTLEKIHAAAKGAIVARLEAQGNRINA